MARKDLDDRDLKLLSLLEADARASVSDLARAVSLSPTAVRQRLARLERDGIIGGYTIRRADPEGAAGMTVLVTLKLTGAKCKILFADFGGMPEIRKFWSLAGELDACLVLEVTSVERLQEISQVLSDHPVVQKVQSHLVIETHKNDRV